MTTSAHSITVRRLIKAGRERVFEAFSQSAALSRWFSPSPDISVEVLAFQFGIGGSYRLRYSMPDGTHPVLGGTYDLIAPPDELAFSWVWEAPDPHADIPTRVHIQFLDRGDATEIVLVHEKLPSKEVGTRHAEGWERTFDNLERSLGTGEDPTPLTAGDAHRA